MNLATIIVTRSKSCHVKTLHAILRLNMKCVQSNYKNEIVFVDDDPYKKAQVVEKYMKTHDRLIFIDFGIGLDDGSLNQLFQPHENIGCMVFPGVKEGVDWDLFKAKLKEGSTEPVNQMGMHFDTEVDKKISDNIYNVTKTNARAWIRKTKHVYKTLSKNKDTKISPKMFEKFLRQNVRVYAFTAAKLTMTYTHECVSNILNAAGVKTN